MLTNGPLSRVIQRAFPLNSRRRSVLELGQHQYFHGKKELGYAGSSEVVGVFVERRLMSKSISDSEELECVGLPGMMEGEEKDKTVFERVVTRHMAT